MSRLGLQYGRGTLEWDQSPEAVTCRRAIPARPPGGHMQRGRDRRPRGRLADPHPVPTTPVNDRLGARYVLHGALRRRDQRVLDLLAVVLVGHRPQHRHRLRHRHRHLDVRDPSDLLDHRPAPVVAKPLAVLVARPALQQARAAQLLTGLNVLPLQHGDQIVALDRLPAPHAELSQRVIETQPQHRGAPARAPLKTLLRELVIAACERLRRRLQLQAIVARPRRVGSQVVCCGVTRGARRWVDGAAHAFGSVLTSSSGGGVWLGPGTWYPGWSEGPVTGAVALVRNLSLPESEAAAVQSRGGPAGPSAASREAAPLTGGAARSYAVSPA